MDWSRLRGILNSFAFCFAAVAAGDALATGPSTCQPLMAVKIPNTTITSAAYVATNNGSGYCEVKGEVKATVAPQHDVQLRLPDMWKGRIASTHRCW